MQTTLKKWAFVAFMLAAFTSISAQDDPPTPPTGGPPATRPAAGKAKPKPYAEVITDKAVSKDGLFKVHQIEDKYFFEIPDAMLGREILIINRISKGPAGVRSGFFGYAGDELGQNVIRFEKGPNDKIFLRRLSFAEYTPDSSSAMFQSVNNSNVQPIAEAFDVKAYSPNGAGSVIDVTDFISGDNDVLFLRGVTKTSNQIGALQKEKSYIEGVRAFPINIEITTVKTHARGGAPAPGTPNIPRSSTETVTIELNSSLVLLPEQPMQARYFDPRVGYFAVGYTDFDVNPQGVKRLTLAKRWRLEPKEGDMEKYLRGELVEPKKPIVFYIDPTTPEKWVPYLMQGVDDWQGAFEKAGFKNAIMAKRAPTPEEDPEWSLLDARYSAILYKPSTVSNAYGPSTADPRSGEIVESRIGWFHNVMLLLRNWYFIQCSPLDPGAQMMTFDDELMGQLIRFVSAHEVGHTLGLRHNHGSSSTVPVDSLRSKAWVEANGHTPSIMDYARFNYVAQPEDNISREGLFPRIGDYDNWAIEWGYRLFPEHKSAEQEKPHLNKWVIEKLKNKRLWFGTESNPDDPRSQAEQVGDDAMKASDYGTRNLKRIVPNLHKWTQEPNSDYSNLKMMYDQVTSQFNRYNNHVAKYVGGIMETPKMIEQEGPVYEIVSKAEQKRAVDYLNKNLFATPGWLLRQDIFDKTGERGLNVTANVQNNVLQRLLRVNTLSKLVDAEAAIGTKAYRVPELLTDLKNGIWSELSASKPIDVYRRQLQKTHIAALDQLLNPPPPPTGSSAAMQFMAGPAIDRDNSDIKSAVRAHLVALKNQVTTAIPLIADSMTKAHLRDMSARIDLALNPKK
ncbi:MAG: zinc-dependent metalloprotease [Saprospiraceae bacterium]|nr:zinc-dependent metalloprotease [Saprospiraceae bacterium]